MSAKTATRRIGILLLAAGAVEIPAAFWWWAIFGMSADVGTAHGVTAALALGAGFMANMASWDMDERDGDR